MAQRGDGSRRAGPERHDERLARWARGGSSGEAPAPAATVILLREAADELETLMLRRNSKIAFGGMWVFPGGRVDPEDAQGLPPGDDLAIARVAAAREAREEAGVALRPEDLLPLSHWTPPPIAPKRFLTWFFVASAPEGRVAIDHGEIREYAWMSASDAFARRDQGEIELAPPTFVTLHTLARWRKVDAALEALRARRRLARNRRRGPGPAPPADDGAAGLAVRAGRGLGLREAGQGTQPPRAQAWGSEGLLPAMRPTVYPRQLWQRSR
jgi:8-oxo-dGTP pyrophosphatase MutT (NUDIX family)